MKNNLYPKPNLLTRELTQLRADEKTQFLLRPTPAADDSCRDYNVARRFGLFVGLGLILQHGPSESAQRNVVHLRKDTTHTRQVQCCTSVRAFVCASAVRYG